MEGAVREEPAPARQGEAGAAPAVRQGDHPAAQPRRGGFGGCAQGDGDPAGHPHQGERDRRHLRTDRARLRAFTAVRSHGARGRNRGGGGVEANVGQDERALRVRRRELTAVASRVQARAPEAGEALRRRRRRVPFRLGRERPDGPRREAPRRHRAFRPVQSFIRRAQTQMERVRGRRGALRVDRDAVPRARADGEGTRVFGAAVRPVQGRDRHHRRLR